MVIALGSVIALGALGFLIPLIIIYLIRPNPIVMEIPSLMFLMKYTGRTKLSSFLKQFIRDWLFVIQLLIFLLLIFSLTKPFMTYEYDISAQNTVIVLDASASMQAKEGSYTRFEEAISKAKSVLGAKNTVILAKEIPAIGIKDASANDVIKYLHTIKPTDSLSRIGDSIILAGEALKDEGRVFVISDFINTGGQDPNTAKSVLEAKGLVVDFVNVATKAASNVGIIDLDADNEMATVYIRNYDDVQRTVGFKAGDVDKQISIAPKSTETFSFKTPGGVTLLELTANDDFDVDNRVYLSAPEDGKIKVALVANNMSIFLKNALQASGDADVTVVQPPVVPTTGFNIYVLHSINPAQLLPGTFSELYSAVEQGASLVVHAQENSDKLDYQKLLPMKLDGRGAPGFISVDQLNKFTQNIEFGSVTSYFKTADKDFSFTTLASLGNDTIIGIGKAGLGKLAYFGILESQSEFKFSPGYPIFWTELMRYLTGQLELTSLNYKTKDTLILDAETKIKTPKNGVVDQATLILETTGVYELPDRKLAVNLLDEKESDINMKEAIGAKSTDFELKPVKETRNFDFDTALLAAACIVLLLELLFVKYRGDI